MIKVAACVLAGGKGVRMGGVDKPLEPLGDKPMLAYVLERLAQQKAQTLGLGEIIINANGDPRRYMRFDLPIVCDDHTEADGAPMGPLAGVLAGLKFFAEQDNSYPWMLTVPGDAPLLPLDLLAKLYPATAESDIVLAASQDPSGVLRTHPVVGLWRVALVEALTQALVQQKVRKITHFTETLRSTIVAWKTPYEGGLDPFTNINFPEELVAVEKVLCGRSSVVEQ